MVCMHTLEDDRKVMGSTVCPALPLSPNDSDQVFNTHPLVLCRFSWYFLNVNISFKVSMQISWNLYI